MHEAQPKLHYSTRKNTGAFNDERVVELQLNNSMDKGPYAHDRDLIQSNAKFTSPKFQESQDRDKIE